jgi:hypothetical protein
METKGKLEVRAPSPHEIRSQRKRQTSNEELDEVRRRGRYVVLPPVEGTQEMNSEDEAMEDFLLVGKDF